MQKVTVDIKLHKTLSMRAVLANSPPLIKDSIMVNEAYGYVEEAIHNTITASTTEKLL